MNDISVIILAKNEAKRIGSAITSAQQISNDIVIVDSGSTDETVSIARSFKATVLSIEWKGFGNARNAGAAAANNDWVFCLDADEIINRKLAESIGNDLLQNHVIYGCRRNNFLNDKLIRFGEWGSDVVYRLYNRKYAAWNLDDVHESIVSSTNEREILKGQLDHYTTENLSAYEKKLERYASLSAAKYAKNGKRAGWFKRNFAGAFNFVKNYVFLLGFLDGKEGWMIAKAHAGYTRSKYKKLFQLYEQRS